MKLFLIFPSPSHRRRSMLRDLYAFGLVHVFRQHSIFRLWEPLRENPRGDEDAGPPVLAAVALAKEAGRPPGHRPGRHGAARLRTSPR